MTLLIINTCRTEEIPVMDYRRKRKSASSEGLTLVIAAMGKPLRLLIFSLLCAAGITSASGQTTVDEVGAQSTGLTGISGNQIVGSYTDSTGGEHGLLSNWKSQTTLDVPGANETAASGISNGEVIGAYLDNTNYIARGYSTYDGIHYTKFDADIPGATGTQPCGISNGTIVGYYYDGNYLHHGFLLAGNNFTYFDVAGADQTTPVAISGDEIVGTYDKGFNTYSFLYTGPTPAGNITPLVINVPGALTTTLTGVSGSQLTGYYYNAIGNVTHGFIYDVNTMTYSKVDVPGGVIATEPAAISGSSIVGLYYDSSGIEHGFTWQTLIWGARVKITPTTGTPWQDFLIGYQYGNVYCQRDFTFSPNGSITAIGAGTPLTQISNITVLADPNPSNPNPFFYGFNKYIAAAKLKLSFGTDTLSPATSATGLTASIAGYAGGLWSYKIQYINTAINGNPATETALTNAAPVGLFGIPLCSGVTESLPTIKGLLMDWAQAWDVPPHIAYGVAWQESKVRWQNYWTNRYPTTVHPAGSASYTEQLNPAGDARSVVSFDGGIGLMQLTNSTALYDANPDWTSSLTTNNPPATSMAFLYDLANSTNYNIYIGCRLLSQKKTATAGKSIGNGDPLFLEHWYNAVWAYNHGQALTPQAATPSSPLYPARVFGIIQNTTILSEMGAPSPALGLPLGQYAVWNTSTGLYYAAARPTLGANTATKVAHADVDLDGVVDVVLSEPLVTPGATTDVISIHATPRSGVNVQSVSVTVPTVGTIGLLAAGNGLYRSIRVLHLVRGIPQTLTFGVTVLGIEADGATYNFQL